MRLKINSLELQVIKEIAEDLGIDHRDYSGRGMYGKSCFGITVESLDDLLLFVVEISRENPEIKDRMGHVSHDAMGKNSTIYYWESIPYEIKEDE